MLFGPGGQQQRWDIDVAGTASMGHGCGWSPSAEQHRWAIDVVRPVCRTAALARGWALGEGRVGQRGRAHYLRLCCAADVSRATGVAGETGLLPGFHDRGNFRWSEHPKFPRSWPFPQKSHTDAVDQDAATPSHGRRRPAAQPSQLPTVPPSPAITPVTPAPALEPPGRTWEIGAGATGQDLGNLGAASDPKFP